jgi:signal transduction histidine kinase
VEIAVEDQGVGFDPAATRHGSGFGLFSVREQVQRLGGVVEIESVPRQGTRVKLQIPLAGPASARSEAPP